MVKLTEIAALKQFIFLLFGCGEGMSLGTASYNTVPDVAIVE
jgi:hypothetical protein